jgi:hypothetical protein
VLLILISIFLFGIVYYHISKETADKFIKLIEVLSNKER